MTHSPDNPIERHQVEYLEGRYNDIKQILEAVFAFFDPETIEDNYLFDTLECEFNYLAEQLDYEDVEAFLDRISLNLERDDEDDMQ